MEFYNKKSLPRRCSILLGILLVVLLAAVWFFRASVISPRRPRRVILISIDTCRADYLSCYGCPLKTTPNIDTVAAEAVRFEHVIAPNPLTLPSHSTMMTGTIPPHHGIHDNLNYTLNQSNVTLAEILKKDGFRTGAVISASVLKDEFGLDQGFDNYDDEFDQRLEGEYHVERKGAEATQHAVSWIEKNQDQNFFLFLHYYDPHYPYEPPEEFRNRFGNTPGTGDFDKNEHKRFYAAEIAYTDFCIGQVIEKLKSLGLYDSTLLIITSDHGEGLGDHKEATHGYYIYQESIHVPLIVKLPGMKNAKTIKDTVGIVDITPTICSLLNLDIPEPIEGKDLSTYLLNDASESQNRYIYSESFLPTKYKASPLLAVVGDRFKYIQTSRPELYDLADDPYERQNIVDQLPQQARIMQDKLRIMLEKSLVADNTQSKFELDDESLKKLESLGYVRGSLEENFSFDQDKPDPKDTFKYHTDLLAIMRLIRTKDYDAAERAAKEFLAQCEVVQVYDHLAQIAMEKKDEPKAIEYLQKAIEIEPSIAATRKNLGWLLLRREKFDEALHHLLKASEILPRSAEISYGIARAYYKLGQKEKAVEYTRKSLESQPNYIGPRTGLANALFELGDTQEAIKEYYKVLDYDAQNIEAINFLAWIQATSRDAQLRKPAEALRLAKLAAKAADYNSAEVMDTLAVAYASVGNFEQAIMQAEKAIELAESSENKELARRIVKRRELFKNQKMYSE